MLYSVSSILFPSLNSSLDGISIDIFFKGCTHHCPGCHNLELQEFSEPTTSVDSIIETLNCHKKKYSIITLMGGEPTDVPEKNLIFLIKTLREKFPDKKISMYTALSFDSVSTEILRLLDYVKCGFYNQQDKTPHGEFLASKNQIMYKKINEEWTIQYSYKD